MSSTSAPAPATAAAGPAVAPTATDNAFVAVVAKRVRALRKKLNKLEATAAKARSGEELTQPQRDALRNKPELTIQLAEASSLLASLEAVRVEQDKLAKKEARQASQALRSSVHEARQAAVSAVLGTIAVADTFADSEQWAAYRAAEGADGIHASLLKTIRAAAQRFKSTGAVDHANFKGEVAFAAKFGARSNALIDGPKSVSFKAAAEAVDSVLASSFWLPQPAVVDEEGEQAAPETLPQESAAELSQQQKKEEEAVVDVVVAEEPAAPAPAQADADLQAEQPSQPPAVQDEPTAAAIVEVPADDDAIPPSLLPANVVEQPFELVAGKDKRRGGNRSGNGPRGGRYFGPRGAKSTPDATPATGKPGTPAKPAPAGHPDKPRGSRAFPRPRGSRGGAGRPRRGAGPRQQQQQPAAPIAQVGA